jgi:hypothetical protein
LEKEVLLKNGIETGYLLNFCGAKTVCFIPKTNPGNPSPKEPGFLSGVKEEKLDLAFEPTGLEFHVK